MLLVSVLGTAEVRVGERRIRIPSGKSAELFVRLALDSGKAIQTDRLVDELWGDAAGATTRNTLQTKVARLRRALGDVVSIDGADGGYRLDADPASVDAIRVLDGLVTLAGLTEAGDDESIVELCHVTLLLFGGELLPGAGDSAWVAPHRARLGAARLQLIEAEAAARLRLGQLGAALATLELAVVDAPYQERLWELLITALYRAGRQADALATYQRVRAMLAEDLGVEPGPPLHRLEQSILRHAPALDDRAAEDPIADSPAGNLPERHIELIGREAEAARVAALLYRSQVVELTGTGGVGKTALALAVARSHRAAGGVWLVRLEGATRRDEVIDAVTAALGVTGGWPVALERLRSASALLVLDNCEHVLDEVAELVDELLAAAPRTRLLCTTQVALGLDATEVVAVEPLAIGDAADLFTARASVQRRNTELDPADVNDLCSALDGLPLAIELAAARTKTMSLAEIGRRLDQRLDLLNDPTSRLPERRKALRATIGWSYDLLFPDDQRGLWALATFAASTTLDAFEHVLSALGVPRATAIDVVGRLSARSLVITDDVGGGRLRHRLLDGIRAFALDALTSAGAAHTAFCAHAEWIASLAGQSTAGTRSADQARSLDIARAERANIDAALAWSAAHDPRLGVTIANGFGWAWIVLGDSRGAQRILAALDCAGGLAPDHDHATALLLAGWIEASTGDLTLARRHVDQAIAIAERLDDTELRARGAYYLAYVVSHDGDFWSGLDLTDLSRALYSGLDRPWDLAATSLFATRAAISAGDHARSVAAAEHARDAVGAVDDPWLDVRYEAMLGELARLQHRFADAVTHIARAAATSAERGFRQTEAYQVASLGRAHCQAGDDELGASTLQSAIRKAEAVGDARMAALARVHLGRVLRALGRDDDARAALVAAAAWHRRVGGGEQAVLGEALLAAIDARSTSPGAADSLRAIVSRSAADANAPAEIFALDALARLARLAGDPAEAARLAQRADALMPGASHFITERDRVDAR